MSSKISSLVLVIERKKIRQIVKAYDSLLWLADKVDSKHFSNDETFPTSTWENSQIKSKVEFYVTVLGQIPRLLIH